MPAKALVTMAIGDDYKSMWEAYYKPSILPYAERHGYELIVVDDYIDAGPSGRARTPHWQKLLILERPDIARFERVVWIDADIFINFRHAPCIVEACGPAAGIGLVGHNATYATPELWDNRWHRAHMKGSGIFARGRGPTPAERYAEAGLSGDVDDMVNTGVMVLDPARHAGFLRQVYDECTENQYSAMEQMALSHRIFKAGLYHPLDPRFNRTWTEEMVHHCPFLLHERNRNNQPLVAFCVTTAWLNAWFLHFLADGISRGDVRLILTRFSDPAQINLEEVIAEQQRGQAG